MKPDIYQASGQIQINMNTPLKPILQGLAVGSDQSNTVAIMAKQLKSRPVLERIIQGTDLGLDATNELQMENLIGHLRNTLNIKVPKINYGRNSGDSIITISYKDPRPKLAYQVVKKAINTLVESTLGANQADTDVAHAFLRSQIKAYEKRLSETEQKLADFKKKNAGVMPDQGGGYYTRLQNATDALRHLQSKLQLARNKVKILKIQIQQEAALSVTATYDKKIKRNQDKLNSLLLQYTDKHPDVQAEKSIIAALKKEKQRAIANATNEQMGEQVDDSLQLDPVYQKLQISLKEAEVNVSDIEAAMGEQRSLIKSLQKQVNIAPEIEAQFSRLNRDYNITKDKYAGLVSRLDAARISSQAEKSSENINFQVIEPPIVPIRPVGPRRFMLNASALLAGLAAFFGITFLILQLKPVFLTKQELTRLTGLPVLGTVTRVLDEKTKKRKLRERIIMISLGFAQLLVFSAVVMLRH